MVLEQNLPRRGRVHFFVLYCIFITKFLFLSLGGRGGPFPMSYLLTPTPIICNSTSFLFETLTLHWIFVEELTVKFKQTLFMYLKSSSLILLMLPPVTSKIVEVNVKVELPRTKLMVKRIHLA